MFLPNDTRIFKPHEITDVLNEIDYEDMLVSGGAYIDGEYTKIYYYNIPVSFDIETTSFYIDETGNVIDYNTKAERLKTDSLYDPQKVAIMYIWQFNIYGRCIIGRTWNEFKLMLKAMINLMALCDERRLIIYVHNLAYETGFLQRQLKIKQMFALDSRDPLYFVTTTGIEFRCSFHLSQMSLSNVGKKLLLKYPAQKLVGDLDYSLLRHSRTPLTEQEIQYCVNDVRVVTNYIQEQIEQWGNITKVPYTSTGVARQTCRNETLKYPDTNIKNYSYINTMKNLTFSSVVEYRVNHLAYMGGFTHSNPYYCDTTLSNVASCDIVSSYPAVMVMEKFPMGKGKQVVIKDMKQFNIYRRSDLLVFRVRFYNLKAKFLPDNYISFSHCIITNGKGKDKNGKEIEPPIIANGRLVDVNDESYVDMVTTSVDFETIEKTYTWDGIAFGTAFIYEAWYLPTPFIECLLKFYDQKNTLKHDKSKELEYSLAKALTNGFYGMAGENPIKDLIEFNQQMEEMWTKRSLTEDELLEALNQYNTKSNRFIFYPWAIFITAYARRNLWKAIIAMGNDHVYSDTDSEKFLNYEKHKDFFEEYKKEIIVKLEKACKYHNIPMSKVCHKGRYLGQWDFEGIYPKFKTIGAKRYMSYSPCGRMAKTGEPLLRVEDEDGNETLYSVSLTVAGVNKYKAVPWLLEEYDYDASKIFKAFSNYMVFPPQATGKLLHTYLDYEYEGDLVDYTGKVGHYHELTGVHLEPVGYKVSDISDLLRYREGVRQRIN